MPQGTGTGGSRPPASGGISGRAIRLQLERLLASKTFSRSERMNRFLRFTVQKALDGEADQLKEYLLGLEVFDRKSSFDPRVDPIVRVEARRLRAKLNTYYETEGRNDGIIIAYPTGSYAPQFKKGKAPLREPSGLRPPSAVSERGRNIVVLPFVNLGSDQENEYFSDGFTEELIRGLTKLEGLRVVAWQSARQFKGKMSYLRELGEQLEVDTALAGSVRRSGDWLRITAQLLNVSDGCYLWSETYERKMRDVFSIQDEISRAIVETLRIKLGGGRGAAIPERRSYDLVAYNLYLRGRFHWNKRTPQELKNSIPFYERSISIDASLAVAYAGLADAYGLQAEFGLMRPDEAMPKARLAAERALEIEPTLAEAHTSLGLIKSLYNWQWAEGERHYRRAIELNPGYATAHHWYALDLLALQGRFDEADRELRLALHLDPLSTVITQGIGYLLMLAGRYDEAIEQYRKALELDAHFYKAYTDMGRAYCQKGSYEEAVAMLQKGRALAGDVPSILGVLGQTHAQSGNRGEALRVLRELTELSERGYVGSTCFALVHLGLGEKERALEWLDLGCSQRELPVTSIKVHPAYASLRPERRFTALLRKMGLEE